MSAATETRMRYQKKRRDLQKQVDTQARTLAGYWREREELLARGDRWRLAFFSALPFAVAFFASGAARLVLR